MTPAERIAAAREDLLRAEAELRAALEEETTRRRGRLMRDLHRVRRMLMPDLPYRSEAGQDVVVDRLLGGQEGGTFVEVGAFDGMTGSNTLFFETNRGWDGLLIEPVDEVRAMAEARRGCRCLGWAVAPEAGEAEFIAIRSGYRQMSGLAQSYDAELLEKVRADPRHAEERLRVGTRTLSEILAQENVARPDFVSLDIEGAELAVLEGFPFARHRVRAWAIANTTGDPRVAEIMRANGYDLAEFCGSDEVYLLSQPG